MRYHVDPADNLFDYFHGHVEDARSALGVRLRDDTVLYLVTLLTERARTDRPAPPEHTLAELHARAASEPITAQARTYRELGDRALWLLGWFRESLTRRTVSPSYYAQMGAAAYHHVDMAFKAAFADAFGPVFRELADSFEGAVGIVGRVRESHDDAPDALGRLYAAWLDEPSEALAARLRARGLVLVGSSHEV